MFFFPILDLLNSTMYYAQWGCEDKFQESLVIPKFSLLCGGWSPSFTVTVFAIIPESRPLLTCGNKMLSNKGCWHEDAESQKNATEWDIVQPQWSPPQTVNEDMYEIWLNIIICHVQIKYHATTSSLSGRRGKTCKVIGSVVCLSYSSGPDVIS